LLVYNLTMKHDECSRSSVLRRGLLLPSVHLSLCAEYGLDRIPLSGLRSFGEAWDGWRDTCGAVTGAYMVLGLKYGAASR
jgi:hypothetical protein